MPKQLEDVEKRLLEATKAELLDKGPDKLNIRDIAKKCRISIGTVYNYFPSKEMLVANVMLADWIEILERVEEVCAQARSVEDALLAIYVGLIEFSGIYSSVYNQYSQHSANIHFYFGRRQRLVSQLSGLIEAVLVRRGHGRPEFMSKFIAEIILVASADKENDFSEYLDLIKMTLDK